MRRICGADEFDLFRVRLKSSFARHIKARVKRSTLLQPKSRPTTKYLPDYAYSVSADLDAILVFSDYMQHLTLKHFILKQRALNLYRQAIRATRCMLSMVMMHTAVILNHTSAIPDRNTRVETIAWIRSEFERNKWITDVVCVLYHGHCLC